MKKVTFINVVANILTTMQTFIFSQNFLVVISRMKITNFVILLNQIVRLH